MIGIVGGMGPHAGLDLVRKIFDNTNARSDQEHLPVSMLSISADIPDRSQFINGRDGAPNPGPSIAGVVTKMADQGCSIIGIACNTAHTEQIFSEISANLTEGNRAILLHMIEEVAGYLAAHYPAVRRVGILATTATVTSRLYDGFLSHHGIESMYLPEDEQYQLSEIAIRDDTIGIKANSNPVTADARGIVSRSIASLKQAGADAVLLACTELPLAVDLNEVQPLPVIDPTNVFARVIISKYAPDKLKDRVSIP